MQSRSRRNVDANLLALMPSIWQVRRSVKSDSRNTSLAEGRPRGSFRGPHIPLTMRLSTRPVLFALLLAAPLLSAQPPRPLPMGVRDTSRHAPFRIISNVYYVGSLGLAS